MDNLPFRFDVAYLGALKQEMEIVEAALLNGSCPDQAMYKWLTGQLQGLRLAERLFQDLVRKQESV